MGPSQDSSDLSPDPKFTKDWIWDFWAGQIHLDLSEFGNVQFCGFFGSGFAPVHLDRCVKSSAELNQEQTWGTFILCSHARGLLML